MRVVAAMSGGVDSAVAAARMVRAGHQVVGVHLALGSSPDLGAPVGRGCCSVVDSADARRVADRLGIPFYVWDLTEQFREHVLADFVTQYAQGRTPNPCLRCNERIKFEALLDKAMALGFDAVATGHYARIVEAAETDGERELHRAVDPAKDQSYVLGVLDSGQLAGACFPLGDSTKAEVRREASALGLAVADKPDSHDLCFVPSGDTRVWLGERLGRRPGPIVDLDGAVVGTHDGAVGFTVGQRKGLQLSRPAQDGRPRYVVRTEVASNTVVVGPAEALEVDLLHGVSARWCTRPPEQPARVGVQVRAHGTELPGTATCSGDGTVRVTLDAPARAVAPGQAMVLYRDTRVIGSATIAGTARSEQV